MISYYSIHEQGNRPYQEDSVGAYITGNQAAFAVADGLGGHGKGDIASSFAVKYTLEQLKKGMKTGAYFRSIYTEGNQRLLEIQKEEGCPNSMKTTLVCCLIKGDCIRGAHIGDSRFYLFQNGKIKYRSKDHSVPQMLALSGEIEESQIRRHPDRNRVLRALGRKEEQPGYQEHGPWKARPGMSILLCTDGFWEYVLEKDMEKTLTKAKSAEQWLKMMKRLVKRRGRFKNQDNFSAIAIWIE